MAGLFSVCARDECRPPLVDVIYGACGSANITESRACMLHLTTDPHRKGTNVSTGWAPTLRRSISKAIGAGRLPLLYGALFHLTATVWLSMAIYSLIGSVFNLHPGEWQVRSVIANFDIWSGFKSALPVCEYIADFRCASFTAENVAADIARNLAAGGRSSIDGILEVERFSDGAPRRPRSVASRHWRPPARCPDPC